MTVDEPDPIGCRTIDDLVAYLRELRAWAKNVSYRELTKRINASRKQQRVRDEAKLATVSDCFRDGRVRLNWDLVVDIGRAAGLGPAGLLRLDQVCRLIAARVDQSEVADVRDSIPSPRAEFTGRDAEIALLDQQLAAAFAAKVPPVLAVDGPAGIGKTELALAYAHRLLTAEGAPRVRLFADLHGFDTTRPASTPEAVLSGLLGLVGLSATQVALLADADARVRRYRELAASTPMLLVLDNVADIASVRPLLPASPSSVVIVTSRYRIAPVDFAAAISLRPLEPPASLELLRRFDIGDRVAAEPETAWRLAATLCRNEPLDLVTLGGQLADPAESAWTLSDHAARLERFPPDTVLRPALAGSCQSLSPMARRVFRLLAMLPDDDFTAHEAAILGDVDPADAADALRELFNRHLLLQRLPARFRFSDVIAQYARGILDAEEPASAQHAALTRLRNATTRKVTMRRARVPEQG